MIAGLAIKAANQFAAARFAPQISLIRESLRVSAILFAGLASKAANQFAAARFEPQTSLIRESLRVAAILFAGLASKAANQFAAATDRTLRGFDEIPEPRRLI